MSEKKPCRCGKVKLAPGKSWTDARDIDHSHAVCVPIDHPLAGRR